MRKYLKCPVKNKDFEDKARRLGADYIDKDLCGEGIMVFKINKIYGDSRLAIALKEDGSVSLGVINEDCDNFEGDISGLETKELEFLIKKLSLILKSLKGGK